MISYYQDTLDEYRGGYCASGGRQTLKTSQRQIPEIAKRSFIQHLLSVAGEICLLSGGSSE
jgi:hypothetical protein